MIRLFDRWQLIAVISLLFPILGCATHPNRSQRQMMATDLEPKREEKTLALQPTVLPQEPSSFEMTKHLPPSAMLSDQEGPTVPSTSQTLRKGKEQIPVPMPSEPKPVN